MKKVENLNQSDKINYQLQTTIKIHDDSVMNLIILKDSRFASSSCDKSIKIFNRVSYKIEINILEHENYVAYIYQLKDERLISSSSDNTIKIFKIFKNTYNVEQILKGHSGPVKKTIELKNGNLVSCSWDKTIKIWKKNNNNLYELNLQFFEERDIQSICEINEKEFLSVSANTVFTNDNENRAISFYKIKNGEFDIINIIENIDISGFHSNAIKINEEYFLIGGKGKIYFISLITYSISKIFKFERSLWIQSLSLLNNGNLIAGAESNLLIFKIIDNNLKLIFDINDVCKINDEYQIISSINEDLNKNIIVSLYNNKIKVFSKA